MQFSRRAFLQSVGAAGAISTFPGLAGCSTLFGSHRPSGIVQVGVIGCGRISSTFEVPNLIGLPGLCRIVAVCDLDSKRLACAKARIERDYEEKDGVKGMQVKTYSRYEDLVKDPAIDAVMVCVPDHWHAIVSATAILAGKAVWVQKPFSQTIHEGRIVANLAKLKGTVLQVSSQQRSAPQFHDACEFVRNGRLGEIVRVEVGLGCDRPGGSSAVEPVPANLDYDRWLGPTDPSAPYNWTRVHNQDLKHISDRPGWIQLAPYGWGMITNWGAHHMDIVQWGLGTEHSGPLGVSGTCKWMDTTGGRLWNVHTNYDLHYRYPGDIDVHVCDKFPCGVRFFNKKGDWIWVSRGAMKVTASDGAASNLKALDASRPELIAPLTDPKVRLVRSQKDSHFLNWLMGIREHTELITSAEVAHRSTSVCILGHMCMQTGKSLAWDPKAERTDNAEANAMMKPFARGPYDLKNTLADYGLTPEAVLRG